jgi:hypothetical protein
LRAPCLGLLLVSAIIVAAACSANDTTSPGFPVSGTGATTSTTQPGGNVTGSGGSTTTIDIGNGTANGTREPICEVVDGKEVCTCVNLASIGMVAHYGATSGGVNTDSTDAFMTWLDTKSTAGTVAKLTTRDQATLTPALLDQYDILVLQHMTNDGKQPAWVFSQAEIDAVKTWVTERGGALFVMSGYESSNVYEIAPTNQLLAFSGIQINADDICGSGATTPLGRCQTKEICPAATYGCCSCWMGPQPIKAWDASHPISAGISAEPYYRGRTISAGDAQVVATYTDGSTVNVAVAKQVGNGRVFVYGDEWIPYTSQWQDDTPNGTAVASNVCYDTAAAKFRTPAYMFQVGRLWYNAIRWLQPAMTCFTITDVIL